MKKQPIKIFTHGQITWYGSIADRVRAMSPERVKQSIEELIPKCKNFEFVEDLTLDVCNDRSYCEMIGMNYGNQSDESDRTRTAYPRAFLFSLYIEKELQEQPSPELSHNP